LLFMNGNVYTTDELTCKQIAKSAEDLLDLYLCKKKKRKGSV